MRSQYAPQGSQSWTPSPKQWPGNSIGGYGIHNSGHMQSVGQPAASVASTASTQLARGMTQPGSMQPMQPPQHQHTLRRAAVLRRPPENVEGATTHWMDSLGQAAASSQSKADETNAGARHTAVSNSRQQPRLLQAPVSRQAFNAATTSAHSTGARVRSQSRECAVSSESHRGFVTSLVHNATALPLQVHDGGGGVVRADNHLGPFASFNPTVVREATDVYRTGSNTGNGVALAYAAEAVHTVVREASGVLRTESHIGCATSTPSTSAPVPTAVREASGVLRAESSHAACVATLPYNAASVTALDEQALGVRRSESHSRFVATLPSNTASACKLKDEVVPTTPTTRSTYLCPDCDQVFDQADSVIAHWTEAHALSRSSHGHVETDPGSKTIVLEASVPMQEQGKEFEIKAQTWDGARAVTSDMGIKMASPEAFAPMQEQGKESGQAAIATEAQRRCRHLCPDCREAFDDVDGARAHWLAAHAPTPSGPTPTSEPSRCGVATSATDIADAPAPLAGVHVERRCRHLCPDCEETFDNLESARAHWMEAHCPHAEQVGDATSQIKAHVAAGESSADGAKSSTIVALAKAQLVESDAKGTPAIVRHIDAETGLKRTVVINDDGSQRTFGDDTVTDVIRRDEGEIRDWIAAMTDRHMRGFVNELSERFVERNNQLYDRGQEFEKLQRLSNLTYFGLTQHATLKELDIVYRRLARSMHPDKNGGTEEAKEQFQHMRERYDEAKADIVDGKLQAAAQVARNERQDDENKENSSTNSETSANAHQDVIKEAGNAPEPEKQDCEAESKAAEPAHPDRSEAKEAANPEGDLQETTPPEKSGNEAGAEAENESNMREEPHPLPRQGNAQAASTPTPEVAAGAEASFGDHDLFCRSRDAKRLERAVWAIIPKLKMVDQNVKILEANFQKLAAAAPCATGA